MLRAIQRRSAAFTAPPEAGTGFLDEVIASVVFELDATLSASTDGSSQTWSNVAVAPADGSAQTAYDFYRGNTSSATTDDPSFVGSVGDPAAYWSFDGGDYFSLKSGTNTTFLDNLHDTTSGSAFWLVVAGQIPSNAGNSLLFGTHTSTLDNGFALYQTANNGAGDAGFFRANFSADTQDSPVAYLPAVDFCVIVSVDPVATTANWRCWVDGDAQYIQRNVNLTNNTAAASSKALIGKLGGVFLPNTSRLYTVAMGNAFIDTAAANSIFAVIRDRHARAYSVTSPLLGDTVSSTIFQLDANIATSVSDGAASSPNWLNCETTPADSSGQTAYDFTNTGAVPFDSRAPFRSRYNPGAGDYFQLTGANTAFFKDLHKTTAGQDFWIAMAFNSDGVWAAEAQLFTTTPTYTAASDGILINCDSAETINLRQVGTAALGQVNDALTGYGSATDYLVVLTYSHSNNNWRVASNSATFTDKAHTFATSVLDAVGKATIGAESDGGLAFADGDWYGFAMGNTYISDTELAQIVTYYEALHNRNYVA